MNENNDILQYRLEQLEKSMEELKNEIKQIKETVAKTGINPTIWVAVIGLFGVIFSTFGSVLGQIIVTWAK